MPSPIRRHMARLTYTSPVAKALWCDVFTPRFNQEYNTTKFGVGILLPTEQVFPLLELIQQCMDEFMQTHPQFGAKGMPRIPVAPSMEQVEGSQEKVENPDFKLVTFSTNGLSKNGQPSPPPTIWDANGVAIPRGTITEIPHGSEIVVVADVYAYDKGAASQGVNLGLHGVQVVRLAERVQAPPPVTGIEGAFVLDGPGPVTAAPAPAPAAVGTGIGASAEGTAAPAVHAAPPVKPPSVLDLLRRGG